MKIECASIKPKRQRITLTSLSKEGGIADRQDGRDCHTPQLAIRHACHTAQLAIWYACHTAQLAIRYACHTERRRSRSRAYLLPPLCKGRRHKVTEGLCVSRRS